jgi:hypothetical protein
MEDDYQRKAAKFRYSEFLILFTEFKKRFFMDG